MLLRISLIVAIIAALAAGALSYIEVTDKIPELVKQRDKEKSDKEQTNAVLVATQKTLKKTASDLAQTKTELADTKSERDKALARADAQSKRADEIADRLAKAVSDRDDAQNQLASYKASGLTPDQVIQLNKNIKDAQIQIAAITEEKALFQRKLTATLAELDKFKGKDTDIKLRADLKGKVVTVDPKWDFVVLNIGEEQGVIQDGELLVSRNGKLVAKVIIRSIQKDRSVANIMPGWKIGEPIEGDEVSPAHPAS